MVGMARRGNRGRNLFREFSRDHSAKLLRDRSFDVRYRLKNDDNVDPADAVSGFAAAAAGGATGAGAGSSRFEERLEE